MVVNDRGMMLVQYNLLLTVTQPIPAGPQYVTSVHTILQHVENGRFCPDTTLLSSDTVFVECRGDFNGTAWAVCSSGVGKDNPDRNSRVLYSRPTQGSLVADRSPGEAILHNRTESH